MNIFKLFKKRELKEVPTSEKKSFNDDEGFYVAAQNSKLFLEKVINTAPIPIFIKDSKHRFMMINEACCNFFGIKREQLIGKTDHDFFPQEQADICIAQDKLVFESGETFINEEDLADFNGAKYRVIIRKSCFEFLNTEKILIATIEDITKQREYEEQLKKAKEKAEETSKIKSEFLANMSHEIRTPMNGIFGFLDLLSSTNLNEEQCEFLNEIKKSSVMLLNVINDILDYSKIEAGKMLMENIKFDIRECVEDIVLLATPSAYERAIKINSLIHTNVPKIVFGDSNKLKQILNNLVSNSVKFTKQGEIFINVQLKNQGADFAVVEFEVTDTGIGIHQDKLELIFESFTQADASATRKFGGTGLGLSIVKNLVNMMNGNIAVESESGVGTIFTFTCKFNLLPSPFNRDCYDILKGKKFISAISDKTISYIAGYYSSEFGATVIESESIENTLNLLKTEDISVLLTDSIEIIEAIRQKNQDLPIIFMDSVITRHERNDNNLSNYYFPVPIRREKLIGAFKSVLKMESHNEAKTRNEKTLLEANSETSRFKILIAEDNEINQKLSAKILTKLGYTYDIVSNGAEAIEAYKNNKYDIILMDCQMPVLDGYQATKAIREIELFNELPRIPIVAITANALKGDVDECLDAGMDNYISKPISVGNLIEVLGKYLIPPSVDN